MVSRGEKVKPWPLGGRCTERAQDFDLLFFIIRLSACESLTLAKWIGLHDSESKFEVSAFSLFGPDTQRYDWRRRLQVAV